MLRIENYYSAALRARFVAKCAISDVKEKRLVYQFKIMDQNGSDFCSIYLTRELDPNGMYSMWGHYNKAKVGSGLTYKLNREEIKDHKVVLKAMDFLINEILKQYV